MQTRIHVADATNTTSIQISVGRGFGKGKVTDAVYMADRIAGPSRTVTVLWKEHTKVLVRSNAGEWRSAAEAAKSALCAGAVGVQNFGLDGKWGLLFVADDEA